MRIETLLFKEIVILPELFLGLSLVYLVLHCTFLAIKKKKSFNSKFGIIFRRFSLIFVMCFSGK